MALNTLFLDINNSTSIAKLVLAMKWGNIINHNTSMLYRYYKLCNSFGGKCIYTPE